MELISTQALHLTIGNLLTGIEVSSDTLKFQFQGSHLTTLVFPLVQECNTWVGHNSTGYYDMLCSCIGRTVLTAEVTEGYGLQIRFDHGIAIRIILPIQKSSSTPALVFSTGPLQWWVW